MLPYYQPVRGKALYLGLGRIAALIAHTSNVKGNFRFARGGSRLVFYHKLIKPVRLVRHCQQICRLIAIICSTGHNGLNFQYRQLCRTGYNVLLYVLQLIACRPGCTGRILPNFIGRTAQVEKRLVCQCHLAVKLLKVYPNSI